MTKTNEIINHFYDICKIPHCSFHNEEIAAFLIDWAKENNFAVKQDESGNVVIFVPATKGYENKDAIIVQGHMDMVCEKTPDSTHDFSKDGLTTEIIDGWLTAKDTSLGADNGIALAMAMTLATDDECEHPALELLFTIDEEVGLIGAKKIVPEWFSGKKLINVDSEDEGVATIGCAGGRDTDVSFDFAKSENKFRNIYKLTLSGLLGGHSGMNINSGRGNAIIELAATINIFQKDYQISEFDGGTAHNAIPRSSSVIFSTDENLDNFDFEKIEKSLNQLYKTNTKFRLEKVEASDFISIEDSARLIQFITEIPHGVFSMSSEMDGMVKTSNNLAICKLQNNHLDFKTSQRSSTEEELILLTKKIEGIAKKYGFNFLSNEGYPSWEPNFESELVATAKKVYQELTGKELKIEVIHAGLECGIIGSLLPGLDMISVGPTIESPHSPDERMKIDTIEVTYEFIKDLIKKC